MAKRVLLLALKDTIAYSFRPGRAAVASGADLLATIPPDLRPVDVTVEDVLAEPSWDMSAPTMLELARRTRSAIDDEGFDGVVLTHGIDTVEDTAFLVDLLAGPAAMRGGIVLTGAMRRLDELSSDGPRNLAASLAAAVDPALAGCGAVVCGNDEVHAARWVSVADATGLGALTSWPYPPLARIVGGRLDMLTTAPARPPAANGDPESDVALIKTYPGIDERLIRAAVDGGARGVVLEGTGAGNVPVNLLTTIDELTRWDIPVVVASRCRTGAVALSELGLGASLAAKLGAIGARGLAASKARVALMVALGAGGVPAVREWFNRL